MLVPRTMLLLVVVAAFVLPVTASTLEEASQHFISYQFDAGSHHDAPDTCASASTEWTAPHGTTDGMLVAPDDVADVFVVDVAPQERGHRLHLAVADVADADSLDLDAFAPGCSGSVLDLVNWPTPDPSPPAPAAGETQHSANVDPWHCDARRWLFFLDGLQGVQEPSSIDVAWTDGTERAVALSDRYGSMAVYSTSDDLSVLLKGAWANVASGWDGTFALAAGPCDAADGGAVYGSAPSVDLGSLDFTPVAAGRYVVQVTFHGAAGELLMPMPAPVSVDPEPYVPFEPADLTDGTPLEGTIGHKPDEPGDDSSPPSSSPPNPPAPPTAPPPRDLASSLSRPTTVSPPPVPNPLQPIVVPATCHWCVSGTQGVWESISYRLSVLSG